MRLNALNLLHFKNYEELSLDLHPSMNCFVGVNGSGKTNVLDAIQCICLTKSAFINSDAQLIQHEAPFFMVKGGIEKESNTETILLSLKQGEKKHLKVNDLPYEKISDHIGKYPLVFVTPNDTDLIREGSEIRRKFFDLILSQIDRAYLNKLLKYNKLIKQRNALLKSFKEQRTFDATLLKTYDEQLMPLNQSIFEDRNSFIESFLPYFYEAHNYICLNREEISLQYKSQVASDFEYQFNMALDKDRALERTTCGIHKDDFVFEISDQAIKKFGSQGQQKSFVIALQLAKYKVLEDQLSLKPLLLLDDIFDKLDEDRIQKLVEMVKSNAFGQIFITDASPNRTKRILEEIDQDYFIFEVAEGQIEQIV